ncbi:ATP-binding protein [Halarcobacter sp.]|uniref:ATP-binding protein n=1 Tax=Halarcobacter sp. TaxID=2321133 RepID=UPI003A921F9C
MKNLFNLKKLTLVYFIVFLSLVFWAFFAYSTMNQMISSQKIYAKIINITGKQRMLSQRTALMAKLSFENGTSDYIDKTAHLLNQMKEDHKFIISNITSNEIKDIYFKKPNYLDFHVQAYFKSVDNFLSNKSKENLLRVEEFSNDILPRLDNAVTQFEVESDKKIEKLMKQELFILLGTLLTILLEAVLIVIPSIRYNKQKEHELKELNNSLSKQVDAAIKKSKKQDLIIAEHSKNLTMKEILNNIAHQWRQPLSIITTCTSGLRLKKDFNNLSDEDLQESIDIILKNSNYLSNTIENFRDFFDESINTYYTFNEVINKAKELLAHRLENKNISIIENIEKDISYFGNETRLVQVFIQILNNSIDVLLEKDFDRYIFIDVKTKNNLIFIKIQDSGMGINEKIQDKIFEPYFTTKHQSIGKGIDLYNCKQMIESLFKGKITASNKEKYFQDKKYKGACFTITIPLKEEN